MQFPIKPMLATHRESWFAPTDGLWAFEPKFDGSRLLYYFDGQQVRLSTRSGRDVTHLYPEIAVPMGRPMILDGELVAINEHGVPDFQMLQPRLMKILPIPPVVYAVFDILWFDGKNKMNRRYEERRYLLEPLRLPKSFLLVPSAPSMNFDRVIEAGFEGIVVKRLDSIYRPGIRSLAWVKQTRTLSVVAAVGGYTPGQGSREGSVGALVLGLWDADRYFIFVGSVGSGFTDWKARNIKQMLDPIRTDRSPFFESEYKLTPVDAVFVKPLYAVEVSIKGWTKDMKMRQPVFKGFVDEIERATTRHQW